jgi:broad specificity phosphatase PhoE
MHAHMILASALGLATSIYAFDDRASQACPNQKTHIDYTVVTGVFQQDDPATNPSTFNFTASNFGLINRDYPSDSLCPGRTNATQWQKLAHYIKTLNSDHSAKKNNERHTLLFLGRHGEGYHNAAETYFGTPAWNCYWSELPGNGSHTWADAHITSAGINQALVVNRFWNTLITKEKITLPETYYTSPLYRCLETANITFSGLSLPRKNPFIPIIKEFFREGISAHTCDRRSNKTYIHQHFPSYKFEKGFAEEDPLWQALHAEGQVNQDIRSKKVLDDVFEHDENTYISVTSHSGEIGSLLRGMFDFHLCPSLHTREGGDADFNTVLGHRDFSLSTGAVLPVLVKATTLKGNGPATTTVPFTPQKTCAAPPPIRDSSCNDCSCCIQSARNMVV